MKTDRVENWLVQNRDKIEKGVEIIGKTAEVLAATVGQLNPVLEAVFITAAHLLNNPEGEEARYLTQQFQLMNQNLERIKGEINQIYLEMIRTSMNEQNFDCESQIRHLYNMLQEFVNAKPEFREKKMAQFIKEYEKRHGDKKLDALYDAVMVKEYSGYFMLDAVVTTEQRSRRAVEDFCVRLKKLFMLAIIAAIFYAALKQGEVGEQMLKKWQVNMENVEKKMKAAVDDCKDNFASQAEMDMKSFIGEKSATVSKEFIKELLDILVQKYDWVSWSLIAFNVKERIFFFDWLAGKKYYGRSNANCFEIPTNNKMRVVVSFCIDPKPINKAQIKKEIEGQRRNRDKEAVAQSLKKSIPNCLVHVISIYKEVVEKNNFQKDFSYFEKTNGASLYIYSE